MSDWRMLIFLTLKMVDLSWSKWATLVKYTVRAPVFVRTNKLRPKRSALLIHAFPRPTSCLEFPLNIPCYAIVMSRIWGSIHQLMNDLPNQFAWIITVSNYSICPINQLVSQIAHLIIIIRVARPHNRNRRNWRHTGVDQSHYLLWVFIGFHCLWLQLPPP